ncbi:MAG: replicative DNA helicase [Legionellales bacterium]|nr:replicative DNA helicase [Legionellales bacterium]
MFDTKPYDARKVKDSLVDALKVPPHSIEAEQAVLGGLMLDNEAWDDVVEKVKEKDFYRFEHQLIFKAMEKLASKEHPFDALTLTETLKSAKELDNIGGELYLFELTKNTPSASNIKAYADIVRERSVLRQLIGVANQIADSAFNPEGQDGASLLDSAEQKVFEIASTDIRGSGPQDLKSLLGVAMEKIDTLYHSKKAITGLATGYYDFDKMTSGLQESDLVIVAGRPSMGKTVFGVNVAEYAAINAGKPVLIFSMEMPGDSIAMRMLSSMGRIEQQKIRSGRLDDDDWPRIGSAVAMLSETPVFIDDTPSLTPSEVRARARRVAREHGHLGLIVIDYLQLMRVPNLSDNRTAEISEISRSLKALAKELRVPVVALSQLNRSLEQRADKRPVMSDLRESGAIEQDADLIAFIYRDEVYNPDSREKGTAEVIIGKQRNGPIGSVRLAFLGQYTRFENLEERFSGGLE